MSKLYIFSGAGISAESGIPTFRDADGLWENHDLDKVCNISNWRDNYDLVHKFYNQRREDLEGVEPNQAHYLVAELQKELGVENVINITTNVDDLFERAGVKNTLHLHGDLTKMVNVTNGEESNIGYAEFDTSKDPDKVIKPAVIFFGESAPAYEELEAIKQFDMQTGDMAIFIGMSFVVVPYWMCLPYHKVLRTININPDPTTDNKGYFDMVYNLGASEGLLRVVDKIILPQKSTFQN